jgi:putative nucleotidyltransferase with HDIG domain
VTSRGSWYLVAVMLAGVLAAGVGLFPVTSALPIDSTHVILLLGLAAFAAVLVILRLERPTRQATSGVGALVLFGALVLTSSEVVVLVLALVAIDIGCRPREQRPPWFVIGFNAAQLMIAAIAAHAVNAATNEHLGSGAAADTVLAAIPAVAVFAAVDYGLLWGVHRFVEPFEGGFWATVTKDVVEEAALLTIMALAVVAWAVQPWLALLALGPFVFFWRLYRTISRLEGANARLTDTQNQAIDGLVQALGARDNEVSGHSDRVAFSTSLLARAIGIDPATEEYEDIIRGALLHDVGKIAIRDAVLHKPGGLTQDEWTEMRGHSVRGYELVESYPFLAAPAEIVLAHHERWDGKGYPRGLAGEQIPLGARLFAIADTFDAITAPRPYRPARSRAEALDEIVRCSGAQFDPAAVDCFLTVCDQFPVAIQEVTSQIPQTVPA